MDSPVAKHLDRCASPQEGAAILVLHWRLKISNFWGTLFSSDFHTILLAAIVWVQNIRKSYWFGVK